VDSGRSDAPAPWRRSAAQIEEWGGSLEQVLAAPRASGRRTATSEQAATERPPRPTVPSQAAAPRTSVPTAVGSQRGVQLAASAHAAPSVPPLPPPPPPPPASHLAADLALAQRLQRELWEGWEGRASSPPPAVADAAGSDERVAFEPAPPGVHRRARAPTADEWGGGLGDVLPRRASSRGHASASAPQPRQHLAARRRHGEREDARGGGADDDRGGAALAATEHWLQDSALASGRRWPIAAIARAAQSEVNVAEGPAVTYEELMALHARDNGPSADPDAWRRVTKLFKPVRSSALAAGGGGDEAACCSICLDPLAPPSTVRGVAAAAARAPVCALPCKHQFHTKCITACVKQGHGCCPNCRYNLLQNRPADTA
jgi:hypothetical protein